MLTILLYIVASYLLLKYGRSYLRVSYEKFVIRSFLNKLDPDKYRILKKVQLIEYVREVANGGMHVDSRSEKLLTMDYVVVSIFGVFVMFRKSEGLPQVPYSGLCDLAGGLAF